MIHENEGYEIIVVGGGISGSMAAIAAGRKGRRVLLIEQYGYLGGMLTASGVGPMMTFHAGDTQVVQGITGELIERLREKGLSTGHIFDTTGYTYTVTPFDPEGMKRELDIMMEEAGVDVLFHTQLADTKVDGGLLKEIIVCNKGGLSTLSADLFVDATGDADLAAMSGVPFQKGRSSDGLSQPMTMKLRVYNVDTNEIKKHVQSVDEDTRKREFSELTDRHPASALDESIRLSMPGFAETFKRAKERGEISFQRENLLFFETNNPGEFIINTSRITGLDSTNPYDLSKAEVIGRQQAEELMSFLRKYIPGFQQVVLSYTGPNVGVRSSRQILGEYILSEEDIVSSKMFDDAILCYGYPMDIHSPTGANSRSLHLAPGAYYSVPYRSLINKQIRNLITVGRCISSTFRAQGSYRTTPGAGAIGHAGGLAAHLASIGGKDFLGIDVKELQTLLREQKAFLPSV